MTKTLIKNTFREIKNTKARFISIMAIIALGVGFFAGIKATSPSMYNLAENYYAEQNLMDYRLVSTTGFSDDDINAVKKTDGVKSVMPSYFCDVLLEEGGSEVRLIAVPNAYHESDSLNRLVVDEGRLPEKSGEIAVESAGISAANHNIGDTIKFAELAGDNEVKDELASLEYTVVGKVQSPLYISYQRGTTTIGEGNIDEYMYLCQDDFTFERYTELYVKADFSDSVSPFSEGYEDKIEQLRAELEKVADERENAFEVEVIDKAKSELAENEKEYQTQKSDAEKRLNDAKEELENGEKEYNQKISEAEQKLKDAKAQLDSGKAQLNASQQEYDNQISSAWAQIDSKEAELANAKAEYEKSKSEAEKAVAEAQAEIDAGYEQYNAAYELFKTTQEPQLLEGIQQAQAGIESINAALAVETNPEIIAVLTAQLEQIKETLNALNAQYSAATEQLEQTKQTLDASQKTLDLKKQQGESELKTAAAQIAEGSAQLEAAKQELVAQQTSGAAELESAKGELEEAQLQYDQGVQELATQKKSGKKQLEDGKTEYETQKKEADKKFADAEKELSDAHEKIDSLQSSVWYVFTRDDNPGYATFTQNADRLDAVASVFPLFFLLVAVLVCVTTMMRLIEEKRTEIATLKALGYSNTSIVLKYVIYSLIAAVSGSVIGITVGVLTLPFVIYNAYKIMYYIGDITLVLNVPSMVIGVLAAVLCTTVVSIFVCEKSLHTKPAQAMRPKAPKAGKRILLERIGVIWKHMGFTAKLTARNLFRYKVRLCMTVVGVAGCTALIVAAFGLLNSFTPLTEVQFGELYRYDAVVVPKDSGDAQTMQYLSDSAEKTGLSSCSMLALQEECELTIGNNKTSGQTYISVNENTDKLSDIICLRERENKAPVTLSDDGVLINEKLAYDMGIKQGDRISLSSDSGNAEATVTGIYEHYINNYVYMTPALYGKLYNKEPNYNMLCVKFKEKDEEAESQFSSQLLSDSRVVAVTFMGEKIKDFKNMLNSLNMVVLVMIICAAGLAFVVLYNLTNINIAERVREIATFKVLGFYNKETSSFIFKENIILSLLGILVGLVLGVFLTGFIVKTVEVDNVMFGRDIFFTTYLYAAGLTMIFSLLVNAVMSVKIKAVDMVESLKSVE